MFTVLALNKLPVPRFRIHWFNGQPYFTPLNKSAEKIWTERTEKLLNQLQ